MDAIEFVIRYPDYIKQLEAVVKPEHLTAIEKLRALDPHDIVRPEHYFNSEAEAVGVVFRLFLRQIGIIALMVRVYLLLKRRKPCIARLSLRSLLAQLDSRNRRKFTISVYSVV